MPSSYPTRLALLLCLPCHYVTCGTALPVYVAPLVEQQGRESLETRALMRQVELAASAPKETLELRFERAPLSKEEAETSARHAEAVLREESSASLPGSAVQAMASALAREVRAQDCLEEYRASSAGSTYERTVVKQGAPKWRRKIYLDEDALYVREYPRLIPDSSLSPLERQRDFDSPETTIVKSENVGREFGMEGGRLVLQRGLGRLAKYLDLIDRSKAGADADESTHYEFNIRRSGPVESLMLDSIISTLEGDSVFPPISVPQNYIESISLAIELKGDAWNYTEKYVGLDGLEVFRSCISVSVQEPESSLGTPSQEPEGLRLSLDQAYFAPGTIHAYRSIRGNSERALRVGEVEIWAPKEGEWILDRRGLQPRKWQHGRRN